jgi:hypothetical protein
MTYKRTQEALDNIGRVGSAATRPSARGIFHDLPAWAQKPKEYFNSLTESYDVANKQLFKLRSRAAWLKLRIKTNQATPGEILEYNDDLSPVLEQLERELDSLRGAVATAARTSWSMIFYHRAKDLLDPATFQAINEATQEILQRERVPSLPQLKADKKADAGRSFRPLARGWEMKVIDFNDAGPHFLGEMEARLELQLEAFIDLWLVGLSQLYEYEERYDPRASSRTFSRCAPKSSIGNCNGGQHAH